MLDGPLNITETAELPKSSFRTLDIISLLTGRRFDTSGEPPITQPDELFALFDGAKEDSPSSENANGAAFFARLDALSEFFIGSNDLTREIVRTDAGILPYVTEELEKQIPELKQVLYEIVADNRPYEEACIYAAELIGDEVELTMIPVDVTEAINLRIEQLNTTPGMEYSSTPIDHEPYHQNSTGLDIIYDEENGGLKISLPKERLDSTTSIAFITADEDYHLFEPNYSGEDPKGNATQIVPFDKRNQVLVVTTDEETSVQNYIVIDAQSGGTIATEITGSSTEILSPRERLNLFSLERQYDELDDLRRKVTENKGIIPPVDALTMSEILHLINLRTEYPLWDLSPSITLALRENTRQRKPMVGRVHSLSRKFGVVDYHRTFTEPDFTQEYVIEGLRSAVSSLLIEEGGTMTAREWDKTPILRVIANRDSLNEEQRRHLLVGASSEMRLHEAWLAQYEALLRQDRISQSATMRDALLSAEEPYSTPSRISLRSNSRLLQKAQQAGIEIYPGAEVVATFPAS